MKTLIKFLLAIACVCMLIACSKSDDDPTTNAFKNSSVQKSQNAHDTKTVKQIVVWTTYWMPIICGGVQIDDLSGTVTVYAEYHYKDGIPMWCNYHTIGVDIISSKTSEKFTVKENDFKQNTINGEWPIYTSIHFNINGDNGSHYLGSVTLNNNTGEVSDVKTKCIASY